jgi:hypothetical protein
MVTIVTNMYTICIDRYIWKYLLYELTRIAQRKGFSGAVRIRPACPHFLCFLVRDPKKPQKRVWSAGFEPETSSSSGASTTTAPLRCFLNYSEFYVLLLCSTLQAWWQHAFASGPGVSARLAQLIFVLLIYN